MKKLAFVLLLAACGSKQPAATTTPTGGGETATVTLPEGVPFDKLDQDQRAEFMKQKVVPVMKPIFQNHDSKRYAEFGCTTCHGDQAKEGHFDMPNPGLPKLAFTPEAMAKFKPENLEWMKKEVLPKMAETLQMPEYDPATKQGFGCLGCHTMADAPAAK